MYAIITELDHAANRAIDKLRKESFEGCSFDIPKMKWPYHISWQGAQDYALKEVESRLRMIAKTFNPIESLINGIGIFSGDYPVLYLLAARTPQLSDLNATLWEALQPLAIQINSYFSPDQWIPHISILYGDVNSAPAIACAVEKLSIKPIKIKFTIDHLSLGSFLDQENKTMFRYPLTGNG